MLASVRSCTIALGRSRHAVAAQRLLSGGAAGMIPQRFNPIAEPEPPEDLYRFLLRSAKWHENPDRVALRCAANDFRPITYRELPRRVSAAAHALRAQGFKQGDIVNIHLHNTEQFVVGFLAISALGGTSTTSNPLYTASELAAQQTDSKARFVLTSRTYADVVHAAIAESGVAADAVSYAEDDGCFANAASTDAPLPELDRPIVPTEDLLVLPYSSGTTGRPKGVMLSHANFAANVQQARAAIPYAEDDVIIGVLPLFHIYGMNVLMATCFAARSTLVLVPKFEPASFLQTVADYKVTAAFVAPPLVLFLCQSPMVAEYDISPLRWVMSGAAPLDAATQVSASKQLAPALVFQAWGMTELSPIALVDATPLGGGEITPGAAGVLPPSTEGIVADPVTGEPLPPGELGELLIRGPQRMIGYLNRPDATAETIRPDGFLRTGDLAYYDDSGVVWVCDRLKELIKVKGLQVAPAELEATLLENEEILDAAVIGIPDERAGQVPKAFVVARPGAALTVEGVIEAMAKTLAPYKLPGEVIFVDSVPKSPSGKILRRMLS